MKRILLAFFVLSMALSANAQTPLRVYINPGHGDWGPLSRPMATVNYAAYDTLGFFESNTNLWKAFALQEKLEAAGYKVMMSRTQNGPYPYVEGDETIDKKLYDISDEANLFGADYFISIHSNANVDGDLVNYPLFLYAGKDYGANNISDSYRMAQIAWPRHFEAFGNDKFWEIITHGFEPNSHYSQEVPNLRGDESFYDGTGLQVLEELSCPGYLVEGYFHTYQPARHRALNPEWCRQEGIRYFRGIQDYFGKAGENVGYIMGCVRSLTEMSDSLFNSMSSSYDEFLPINGAKVVLRDASGNIIRTECYRHVARHITDQYYYTTDHNYNGIFVFENLKPDTYTLTVHAAEYEDKTMTVDVVADKTVYPEIFLTRGPGGTEPNIDVDVQWVLNGGTVDGTLPSTITEEYRLPIPYKAGYVFQGWNTEADGTGEYQTTLPVGYKGTLYAIWRAANVKWELNGGHVSENKLLWEDFQRTKLGRTELVSIENAWSVIETYIYDANQKVDFHAWLTTNEYKWLGDYLWNKANPHVNPGSGNEYIWWGNMLNAFLNSTTYNFYCHHCSANVTVDFTELGKYDSWKSWATEEIRQKVTLPNQITSDYTIPTPEKEGATFQGWYDNPHGMGEPITKLQAGYEGTLYAIWVGPVPCIVAYDLNCTYKPGAMAFDFSFYANTQPASGKLIFYNEDGQTKAEYNLSNLRQGKNTIFIQAESLHALGLASGQDIYWDVELETRPSTLFAEIFRSKPFHTAYATIDNNPASDFFGSIWVASQEKHGYNTTTDGEIWRLVPEQGYAREGGQNAQQGHRPPRPRPGDKPNPDGWKPPQGGGGQPPQSGGGQPPQGGGGQQPPQGGQPNGGQPQGGQQPPRGSQPNHAPAENTGGFEVIFRPTVAPDGTVYLTDNGPSYGGVFIMDPHTKQITNFFEGCTYENGEWKDNNGTVVGSGSTGAHIYWTEDETKLFLMHNAHETNDPNGVTKGFFTYNLMDISQAPQHTNLKRHPFLNDPVEDYVNTGITDYAIVGTSRGAWVCQLRNDKGNFFSDPSLTFYPNEGDPTIFSKALDGSTFEDELIHGSFGSAIAVNKTENLLAMVGGTGNIMLFDISWEGIVPTLSNKRDYPIVENDPATNDTWDIPTITTLNFDYAGNLVATLGETYNDSRDQHQVAIFTLPKAVNKVDVPARKSQFVPSLVEDEQCASVAEANKTYQTVKLYRKLQSGMYNTICLPFGLTTLNGTPLEGASVLQFVGSAEENKGGEPVLKLNFQEVTAMTAGVPYLIKPLQDIKDPMLFSGVEMGNSVGAREIKINGITFKGVIDPTELPNQNMLMLVANNRLATSTGGTMQGNRGYFLIGDNLQNMPKRAEIAIVKGAPTNNDNPYTNYQPTSYKILEDGHIWIIRDGVKYNLMGARVR